MSGKRKTTLGDLQSLKLNETDRTISLHGGLGFGSSDEPLIFIHTLLSAEFSDVVGLMGKTD